MEAVNVIVRDLKGNDPLLYAAVKAIGRARRTVDGYIADLRAATQMDTDIKIFRMHRLGIPQDRMAKRLGYAREVVRDHLAEMAVLPNPPNADLSRGFTVAQVAEKHGWPEPLVWSLALEGKTDPDRFKALGWGFRTWDQWEFYDCDNRFGDDWPGPIPARKSSPSHGRSLRIRGCPGL